MVIRACFPFRRKPCLVSLLAIVAVALIWVTAWALWPAEKEPEYQGKKLSDWLIDPYRTAPTSATGRPTRLILASADQSMAICQIGTNALPFLLRWLDYQPSDNEKKLRTLLWRIPNSALRNTLARRDRLAFGAKSALSLLGTDATSAIDQLARMSTNYHRMEVASSAVSVLPRLGPRALNPLVAAAASDRQNFDHSFRITAAMSLLTLRGRWDVDLSAALPTLLLLDSESRQLARKTRKFTYFVPGALYPGSGSLIGRVDVRAGDQQLPSPSKP